MAGDNSSRSGHALGDAHGVEVLQASLLTQEIVLRVFTDSVDIRFQVFKGCFDEIADRLDALALDANRGRNEDMRRLRDVVAQSQPISLPVPVHHYRQLLYIDDSEREDKIMFIDHRPTRGGDRQFRDFERDGGDFKFKVDIPFFSCNLNIEDFID